MKIDAITKSVAEAISKIVDESYDSSGAYEKWDPKHPHFVKNYKKFQASNPGSTLTHFIAHLKKGVKEELNIDEANAPSVKIPVKGGMRVYGGAPGGSAKAYKDQHADPFSTTRGPSDTELKDVESEKKKVKKEETSYKGRLLAMVAQNEEFQRQLDEVLSKDAGAGAWIHDFVHSDNPKFKGKSTKQRQKMALGAYYAKQRNEEVESLDEIDLGHAALVAAAAGAAGPYIGSKIANHFIKRDIEKEKKQKELLKQSKIKKEDVEQIDELSVNKMLTYRSAATEKLGKGTPEQDVKRKSGIGMSGSKIIKKLDLRKEGKDPAIDAGAGAEPPFAPPYNTSSSPAIKDKSGAVHTPMSRAKHLARTAIKKITKDLGNK